LTETLAELQVRITADISDMKRQLNTVETELAQTGKALTKETKSWQEQFKAVGKASLAMGAAITAAMTTAIVSFTKAGSALNDLSLKTGVSAKTLAGLQFAAEQNGASLGTIEMAIRRTASALTDAQDGLATTVRAFDRMGISLTELKGLNSEEQFLKIAGAIAEIPDPMTRAAVAQDLFGRSGMDMLPMLAGGAAGLKKLVEEGQRLTGWTNEGVKSADALGDAFDALKTSTMGIFNAIGASLAPTLTALATQIKEAVVSFSEWARAHPELTKQLSILALALGALLTIAGTLIMVAPQLAAAFVLITGPVGVVTAAVFALIAAGAALALEWDHYAHGFADLWGWMKTAVLENVKAMLGYLDKMFGWLPGIGTEIRKARAELQGMIDTEAIKRDMRDVEVANRAMVDSINSQAKQQTGVIKGEIEKQKSAALSAHSAIMSALQAEYDQKIKTLTVGTESKTAALQAKIDAIDKKSASEDQKLRERERANRTAELQGEVALAKTAEEKFAAEKALADYLVQIRRERLLESREDEKASLQQQIVNIQVNAEKQQKILDQELIDTRARLVKEEDAIRASYDVRLTEATLYQTALEDVLKNVTQEVRVNYIEATTPTAKPTGIMSGADFGLPGGGAWKPSQQAPAQPGGVGSAPESQSLEDWLIKTAGKAEARRILTENGFVPSFGGGGTVPGPIGAPMLIRAHGGEEITPPGNEMGPRELVVNIGNYVGDEASLRALTRRIQQILGEESRRNAFGQVNAGYYFGRSSI
jgi:hypothetical protein